MAKGTVKWFNNAKGYGFVLSEDKQEDLFIHYSSIQMDGYKSLKAGQEVQYDLQEGPKGMHAVNIRCGARPSAIAEASRPNVEQEDNLHLNPMHQMRSPAQAPIQAPIQANGELQKHPQAELEAEV